METECASCEVRTGLSVLLLLYNFTSPLDEVASQMLEMEICSSLCYPKVIAMGQSCSDAVIFLAKEDVEDYFYAFRTMPEEVQVHEWRQSRLGKLHR
jgi:hypothetical protein